MATLPTEDRLRVRRALNRATYTFGGISNVLKSDLQAAVDATDNWIDSNQASYNAALPPAFRNNATISQKTLLFCAVALARVGISWLKAVFGEVD